MRNDNIVAQADIIIKSRILCDHCLGRLFGLLGYGLDNRERGRAIKTLLLMNAYSVNQGIKDEELIYALARSGFEPAINILKKFNKDIKIEKCEICNDIFDKLEEIAKDIAFRASEYEYNTFQIGCHAPLEIIRKEENIWTFHNLENAESFKNEFTRELGKIFSSITNKEYSQHSPDLLIVVDLTNNSFEISSKSIYLYGRYRKLVRGLPQNPWIYEKDERIKYDTSIEELIIKPLISLAKASGAKFHASGREDIDVRMLGNGRPFVVEIKNPKIRSINLLEAEKEINKHGQGLIEVSSLKFVDKSYVSKIKALSEISRKVYVAVVKFSKNIDENKLVELEKFFKNIVIIQRTPTRVLHRRSDKIRRKIVYEVKAKRLNDNVVEFQIECQGGLYIKELIHGDGGRTKPSFSDFLNNKVSEILLDVVDIQEIV